MKNGDMPAMPMGKGADGRYWLQNDLDCGYTKQCKPAFGLTKREMFAMTAMQGLLADPSSQIESSAHIAVIAADLLLRVLDGEDVRPKYEPNPDDFPVMPGGEQ